MLLSDAIRTGSLTVKPAGGFLFNPKTGEGCALGMAGVALDLRVYTSTFSFWDMKMVEEDHYEQIQEKWPWIIESSPTMLPCGCDMDTCEIGDFGDAIMHIFDSHVCPPLPKKGAWAGTRMSAWSLDLLIDYVRSVEPKEETAVHAEREAEECIAV